MRVTKSHHIKTTSFNRLLRKTREVRMPDKNKRKIQPVQSRNDKQLTYQDHMTRYKKAMAGGFFFEAIVIDYACMEDRLRYMLYYLGVLRNESDISIGNSATEKEFRSILREYEDPKGNMGIGSIANKRKIIRSVFKMVSESNKEENDNKIRILLCAVLHDEDHEKEILRILQDMEEWCKYRNEIIHCLLNKNLESLHEQVEAKAKEGFRLFRRLDNQVRWVSRKKIREKLKLKS